MDVLGGPTKETVTMQIQPSYGIKFTLKLCFETQIPTKTESSEPICKSQESSGEINSLD